MLIFTNRYIRKLEVVLESQICWNSQDYDIILVSTISQHFDTNFPFTVAMLFDRSWDLWLWAYLYRVWLKTRSFSTAKAFSVAISAMSNFLNNLNLYNFSPYSLPSNHIKATERLLHFLTTSEYAFYGRIFNLEISKLILSWGSL